MTDADAARERKRRGYWLALARRQTEYSQNDVAKLLGLKAGTSVLAWEKGRRDPDASQMRFMADLYGVPVSMFADPDPTDEEDVMAARAELARGAIGLAHEDLAAEAQPGHAVAARRVARPRKQPERMPRQSRRASSGR